MTATATAPRRAGAVVTAPDGPGRRRRRRRWLVVLVALLLLLAATAWSVLASGATTTRHVVVEGASGANVRRVREAAAVPLGRPLARQEVDEIAQRAAQVPQVASVRVVRKWPRTVLVTVEERRPLLAVRQADGYALVDRTGVAYETASEPPRGVLAARVDPGNQPVLARLGAVAEALPGPVRDRVQSLAGTSQDELSLTLTSGVVVRWGGIEESPLKGQLLAVLLERHPTTSVDLTSPHNPAVR